MRRGEIWWARLRSPAKTRPVLLVSRDEAYRTRQLFMVAPVSRRVRGIPTEIALGPSEGLRVPCVANCDSLRTIGRAALVDRAGSLAPRRTAELDSALKLALGIE